ncbi:MAG: bifunctional (p)ppGpp synthetase/guanosine-3',5'-bis(diphosphate) 3'-pyrophosphohydrolase [Bacteroidaceae bacterium]|nr:bifunctional (p)ppGpp synthetase/guanosine-3',5'-bis(diphosphate) 3'-pyrophosphohydrolase [Bacteroidaceae bacterium]
MVKLSNMIVPRLRALLALWRDEAFSAQKEMAREVTRYLDECLEHGAQPNDIFGLDKLQIALESIVMARKEIGVTGNVAVAFILDTLTPTEDIQHTVAKRFGKEVAEFLAGFRRVEALDTHAEAMKTDNFRNLLVAQAGDVRVVLLLIARHVQVMRLIKDHPNAEAVRIFSLEAAHIYAPLAHKLGLYTIKSELEDLSLKYLEHDAYYHIKEKLNATKQARDAYVERFTAPIRKALDEAGFHYHMKARTKSIHSIWQKMKKQRVDFEGVFDLFAIRIILDTPHNAKEEKAQCWKTYSIVTDGREIDLKRLRDWLTVPKSNGYESLHITVKGPEDKWVEVQIRTQRMDDIAEHGLAAHWRYKGVKSSGANIEHWLSDIRSALEQGDEKLLQGSLSEKLQEDRTYVFTPKGDLYSLPAHATVLDFAYHIHSAVGNRCTGAKIGGRNVSLRRELKSGETVEVITSNNQTPKAEWEQIVVSSHARSKIRAAVKELGARQAVLAREQLERRLKNRKVAWEETLWNRLVRKQGYKEANEFFSDIASGKLDVNDILEAYTELSRGESQQTQHTSGRSAEEYTLEANADAQTRESDDVLVIDRNLKGVDFRMGKCCNPVYGDDVFGFVTVSGGITIHRTNCPNAPSMRERYGYRIVKARWAGKGGSTYPITLRIVGNDDLGIVNNITSIISHEQHVMLRSIRIDSHDGLFSGILTVMVENTEELGTLIRKLTAVKGVKSIVRV